ncbi:hypothetical protein GMRT_10992 [Giardia muris]|uniref:Uncharacterized protein n=1 Tax=Giardia muris TaxID=5742 RepID=A0A4Z1T9X4_GIAMU|nr:hypothetical protein GMRT_10992 [Giardia muris]|eukprot:TNJ29321.1 hypothetical protein GMRT_10992 [Giardia muris]
MYAQAKPKAERAKPTQSAGPSASDDAFRRAQRENAHRRRLMRERAERLEREEQDRIQDALQKRHNQTRVDMGNAVAGRVVNRMELQRNIDGSERARAKPERGAPPRSTFAEMAQQVVQMLGAEAPRDSFIDSCAPFLKDGQKTLGLTFRQSEEIARSETHQLAAKIAGHVEIHHMPPPTNLPKSSENLVQQPTNSSSKAQQQSQDTSVPPQEDEYLTSLTGNDAACLRRQIAEVASLPTDDSDSSDDYPAPVTRKRQFQELKLSQFQLSAAPQSPTSTQFSGLHNNENSLTADPVISPIARPTRKGPTVPIPKPTSGPTKKQKPTSDKAEIPSFGGTVKLKALDDEERRLEMELRGLSDRLEYIESQNNTALTDESVSLFADDHSMVKPRKRTVEPNFREDISYEELRQKEEDLRRHELFHDPQVVRHSVQNAAIGAKALQVRNADAIVTRSRDTSAHRKVALAPLTGSRTETSGGYAAMHTATTREKVPPKPPNRLQRRGPSGSAQKAPAQEHTAPEEAVDIQVSNPALLDSLFKGKGKENAPTIAPPARQSITARRLSELAEMDDDDLNLDDIATSIAKAQVTTSIAADDVPIVASHDVQKITTRKVTRPTSGTGSHQQRDSRSTRSARSSIDSYDSREDNERHVVQLPKEVIRPPTAIFTGLNPEDASPPARRLDSQQNQHKSRERSRRSVTFDDMPPERPRTRHEDLAALDAEFARPYGIDVSDLTLDDEGDYEF